MPRRPRLQFPGALYHVTARGTSTEKVFLDDSDRELFLRQVSEVVGRFGWVCHAYCLMGTHYHLIVETPAPNVAAGTQRLNGFYAQAFNRFHGRRGHLFQGRYHAVLVEKEVHLLAVARYVVLNPVRAGLSHVPEEWVWSSYRSTAGLAALPDFLTVDWLLGQLSSVREHALQRYRAFVLEGVRADAPKARSGLVGSDSFVRRFLRPEPTSDRGIRARGV